MERNILDPQYQAGFHDAMDKMSMMGRDMKIPTPIDFAGMLDGTHAEIMSSPAMDAFLHAWVYAYQMYTRVRELENGQE